MKQSRTGIITYTVKEYEQMFIDRINSGERNFYSYDFKNARARKAFDNLKTSGRVQYDQSQRRYVLTVAARPARPKAATKE